MGLHLVMTTVIASTVVGCSWAHPGANPYRGDPVAALADFDLRDDTRRQLRTLMAAHRATDVATITRDTITGHDGAGYVDLREMHGGHGQVCHGAVDRSAWSARRHERALVYCANDACVLVPTICNNVSLVSRKPGEDAPVAPRDDMPIDISPAAGPPSAAGPPGTESDSGTPPETGAADSPPTAGTAPPSGGPVPVGGGGCCTGLPPSGPTGPGSPVGPVGGDCCAVRPPSGPTPPIAPVPEPPDWLALAAGLALLARRLAHEKRARRPVVARNPATVSSRRR